MAIPFLCAYTPVFEGTQCTQAMEYVCSYSSNIFWLMHLKKQQKTKQKNNNNNNNKQTKQKKNKNKKKQKQKNKNK